MRLMRSTVRVIASAGLVVGVVGIAAPAQSRVAANQPIMINCSFLSMAEAFATTGCGWCGATARGVRGNGLGPLEPCPPANYMYTAPRSTPG